MPRRLPPLARKLLWFAGIYAASVVVVVAVAYGLRALLIP
jgi:hypothetical protein